MTIIGGFILAAAWTAGLLGVDMVTGRRATPGRVAAALAADGLALLTAWVGLVCAWNVTT